MSQRPRLLKLGAFFNYTGHHVASWRHPRSQADMGINFRHMVELAQKVERARFDMMFLADQVSMRDASLEALSRSAQYVANFEPITLISALSTVTKHLGLVATASTSYSEPYNIARYYASVDHISGGRAAWNIVTTGDRNAAQNFGRDVHFGHAERYDRAREFTRVVFGLWDSWEDDAFCRDKENGRFFDPAKLHTLDHHGQWFNVRGPLNIPRPVQGRPVIVQAGASEDGRAFAGEFAEAIFSNHLSLDQAQKYYADIKSRATGFGRNPAHVVVMPGLSPVVGRTEAEAKEKEDHLQSLVHPAVAMSILSTVLQGADLSGYDLDGPVPDIHVDENATHSGVENWMQIARRENLTIRQLAQRVTHGRGKSAVVGSAVQVADHMERWFREGGADGFNIMAPVIPGFLDDFCEMVIPILQERGLFRREYEGETLRDNLGLPRPESRYRAAKVA